MAQPKLDEAVRRGLLRCARAAVAAAIGAEDVLSAPGNFQSTVTLKAGAFVTLRVDGDLRGCIGYMEADRPLIEVVERCAVSAAISDPRFPALHVAEWRGVRLEISVLGPILPVIDVSELELGRHGLVAELGHRRGLLLPQVAVEWHWDHEQFAAHTCAKAGLPEDAWRHNARLYKFEAEVFGE